MNKQHIPVLLQEVLSVARPQLSEIYIDLTAGFGGHAAAILERIGSRGDAWLVDQDIQAITALRKRFSGLSHVHTIRKNFGQLDWTTLPQADIILLDIGVSSFQLDQAERGFSFRPDMNGPLDMRMDQHQASSAADIIASSSEQDLADIIWRYGEEPRSRRIAKAIVAERRLKSIQTTQDLVGIIHASVGSGGRIDSATKTFQALRIAVNDELRQLEDTLPRAADHLKPGGRLIVISFHSLEDRIVKRTFTKLTTPEIDPITGQITTPPLFMQVTKKPLTAAPDELDTNPRARSAKLRAVEKQN